MGINYRPEIDGLRAIAVLAVVLFHAGIGSAGFVGVDVFFVISGYLITSILISEPKIDLVAFYARRVRRIFPAAAVVVLAVLAFAWLLPGADAPQQAAKSAGAALVFGANVFFEFTTGGYWDTASDEMPLLHLWSLSVEEQFYFVWPALLMFTRSRKVIAGLAVASFVLAEYWMATNPEAAFFRMPARFWELAVGGLIACAPRMRLSSLMGIAGVVLTLVSCAINLPHFPASGALPSVLGAGLVIAYVHGGGTNGFLASKPMVAIGLVSYSLYLWHWPLLAIYKANGGVSVGMQLELCAIALVLAVLTYRYVEQPFRRMRFRSGRTVAAGAAASALLALSACAVGLREPPPDPAGARIKLAAQAMNDHLNRGCYFKKGDSVTKCHVAGAKVTFWGDSMALAWSAGLPGSAVFSFPSCPPVVGREGVPGCREFNDSVPRHLQGDTLYLVGRWSAYGETDITRTLQAARNFKRVVVIGPIPMMQGVAWDCIRGVKICGMPRAEYERAGGPILARLRNQAKPYPNVEVWDMTDEFCTGVCGISRDGVYLYSDAAHPTVTQVKRVFLNRSRPASVAADG